MACVFIREALKEHLHGLKACMQQHKIHYPTPHAGHDNAGEITCIFHGITFKLSKQSLQVWIVEFFCGFWLFFFPLESSFVESLLMQVTLTVDPI